MPYSVPVVVDWPGTVIAINVGGALIPTLVSVYLLAKNQVWGLGLVATACVAAISHWLAQPVPGVGIAVPTFVPAVTAAVAAWLLSRRYAAPLAYVGGSMARWSEPICSTSALFKASEHQWLRSAEPAPLMASFSLPSWRG